MKLTEEQRAFVNEVRFGVLATVNADGSPQQTVMWYLPQGDTIMMNTLKGRMKDKNLERDNRASVLIEEGERYVALRGHITIDPDPVRGQETMREITTRYEGPEEAERHIASTYSKQHRITLTFVPEKVDTHGFDD